MSDPSARSRRRSVNQAANWTGDESSDGQTAASTPTLRDREDASVTYRQGKEKLARTTSNGVGRTGGLPRHNTTSSTTAAEKRPWYTFFGRGMYKDVRARLPYYVSDWTDAWNYRVVPATWVRSAAGACNRS